MKAISVLGSTGSIGTQTLEIAEEFPERFRVVALTAGTNISLVVEQIKRHHPEVVALADASLRPLTPPRAVSAPRQPPMNKVVISITHQFALSLTGCPDEDC